MNKNSNGKRLLETETCTGTGNSSSSAPAQTTATAFTEGSILDCQKEIEKCRRKIMNLNEILSNAMDALVARDSDTKSCPHKESVPEHFIKRPEWCVRMKSS